MWSYRIYNTNKEAEQLSVTPSSKEQVKLGLFNRVEVSGDENLKPGNIKKDVKIFGVTGTLEKTSGGSGAVTYTVTFDSNGGSEIGSQEIVDGYQAKRPEDPTKSAGIFETWLLNGEEFDFSTPITEDITLTAKWLEQLVNYKMIYDGSLGKGSGNFASEVGGTYRESLISGYGGYYKEETNYIKMGTTSLVTVNSLNLTDYVLFAGKVKFYLNEGSDPVNLALHVKETKTTTGDNLDTPTANTEIETTLNWNTSGLVTYLDTNISKLYNGHLSVLNYDKGGMVCIYGLMFFKQDNWQELCTIAGLNPSDYTDETVLCANSDAINTILQSEEAVNYMMFFCTGTFMYNFIRNSSNITALSSSPYGANIRANTHWAKFLSLAV